MRKSLFIFSAIMIFSTIIASTDDDSSSTTDKIKAFFKKKIKKANNKLEHFNQIASSAKKEYRGCLEPTLSVSVYDRGWLNIHTPTFGAFIASSIGFGLLINNPSLKLAFFAALLAPYATEVCTKTTAQSIVKTNNHDSPYMISDIVAQNALIITHGD
jgi:hypothetical protein